MFLERLYVTTFFVIIHLNLKSVQTVISRLHISGGDVFAAGCGCLWGKLSEPNVVLSFIIIIS